MRTRMGPRRAKTVRKSLVTAVLAGSLLFGSAVPAHAATPDHCLHPPITADDVVGCACIAVVTILRDVTGDPWTCAA
jgi:hypothetical protein